MHPHSLSPIDFAQIISQLKVQVAALCLTNISHKSSMHKLLIYDYSDWRFIAVLTLSTYSKLSSICCIAYFEAAYNFSIPFMSNSAVYYFTLLIRLGTYICGCLTSLAEIFSS